MASPRRVAVLERDGSDASSVDLLARSINDATSSPVRPSRRVFIPTPTKKRRKSGTANVTPTPVKSADESDGDNVMLQDFYVNTPPPPRWQASPTRSVTQTEDLISPWRIRVRVEAERDGSVSPQKGGRRRSSSPVKPRVTTTTVPLKGGEESPPLKRGRGRPRKSDGPVKRRGTPVPTRLRRKTQGDLPEDASGLEDAAPLTPKGARGRRRKSDVNTTPSRTRPIRSPSKSPAARPSTANAPAKRGRRKTLGPADIAIDSSVDKRVRDPVLEDDPRFDLTDEAALAADDADAGLALPEDRSSSPPTARSPLNARSLLSPQTGRRISPSEVDHESPTKGSASNHMEFDTIMESEGFSMVSLGTLPSARQLNLAQDPDARDVTMRDASLPLEPHRPDNDVTDRNEMSGGSFLSRMFNAVKQKTPLKSVPAPSLPPPPLAIPVHSPRALEKSDSGTPKLVRVVRAGIALQGVLGDEDAEGSSSADPPPVAAAPAKSPRERVEDLFSGFGPGTRRELRAGLRLGEELAKRQKLAKQAAQIASENNDDVFSENADDPEPKQSPTQEPYTLSVPELRGTPAVPNEQLPSPEDSGGVADEDQMSWRIDTPRRMFSQAQPQSPSRGSKGKGIGPKSMAEREAEWDKERKAVSKQIDAANASQVVVIPGDDPNVESSEDENGDEHPGDGAQLPDEATFDIWQAEAKHSSHLSFGNLQQPSSIAEDIPVKPRRSKLPTPWRRQSNSRLIYSDEADHDELSSLKRKSKQTRTEATPESRKRARHDSPKNSDAFESGAEEQLQPEVDRFDDTPSHPLQKSISASVQKRVWQQLLGGKDEAQENADMAAKKERRDGEIEETSKDEQASDQDMAETSKDEQASDQDMAETFKDELASDQDIAEETFKDELAKDLDLTVAEENEHVEKVQPGQGASTQLSQVSSMNESAISQDAAALGDLAGHHAYDSVANLVQHMVSFPTAVAGWLGPSPLSTISRLAFQPVDSPATAKLENKARASAVDHAEPVRELPHYANKPLWDRGPFSLYLPWQRIHYDRLDALYNDALASPDTHALSPLSPYARFIGTRCAARGWAKRFTALEASVIGAFMDHLGRDGLDDAPAMARLTGLQARCRTPINAAEVASNLFSIWVVRVQRGALPLQDDVAGDYDPQFLPNRPAHLRQQKQWLKAQRTREKHGKQPRHADDGAGADATPQQRRGKSARRTGRPSVPLVSPHKRITQLRQEPA